MSGPGGVEFSSQSQACLKKLECRIEEPPLLSRKKKVEDLEQRICMLHNCNRVVIYDLQKNSCKSLPPIPIEFKGVSRCHFVKQKLVLITDTLLHSTKRSVWLYDFVRLKWGEGAKMPIWMNGFASVVDEQQGTIYVAGGINIFYPGRRFDRRRKSVRSALVYNVEEDNWGYSSGHEYQYEKYGGFSWRFCRRQVLYKTLRFEVFDSYTKTWKTVENRFHSGDLVSAFGRLYCFSDWRLIEFDYSQDKVNIVRTSATKILGRVINFAAVISNKIFVDSWDGGFSMLEFQSERGGTFKLIGIDRPSGLQGSVICAATLDL